MGCLSIAYQGKKSASLVKKLSRLIHDLQYNMAFHFKTFVVVCGHSFALGQQANLEWVSCDQFKNSLDLYRHSLLTETKLNDYLEPRENDTIEQR